MLRRIVQNACLALALVACSTGDDTSTTSQELAHGDAMLAVLDAAGGDGGLADAGSRDAELAPADGPPCVGQPEPACPASPDGYRPQNPGIPGGGQCRGACGPACPPSCSIEAPVTTCLEWQDAQCGWHAKTCTYKVQKCGSHTGCRIHDSCYDNCAKKPTGLLRATCRRACDVNCLAVYGGAFCESWMTGGKPYDSYMEYTSAPTSSTYDSTCY